MLKRTKSGDWIQETGTHFIVVDLDVLSRRRLRVLCEAFADRVIVLHEGRWGSRYSAHFELHGWNQTADQQIRDLLSLIAKLPRPARRLWDHAQSKVFNVGIQAGLEPHSHEVSLSPATVARMAHVGASLTITTYAPDAPRPARSRRGGKLPKPEPPSA